MLKIPLLRGSRYLILAIMGMLMSCFESPKLSAVLRGMMLVALAIRYIP